MKKWLIDWVCLKKNLVHKSEYRFFTNTNVKVHVMTYLQIHVNPHKVMGLTSIH